MSSNSRRTHSSSARSRSTQLSSIDPDVRAPSVTARDVPATLDARAEFVGIVDAPEGSPSALRT
jgi:hypothetical protein